MLKNYSCTLSFSKLFVIFLNRVNFEFWGFSVLFLFLCFAICLLTISISVQDFFIPSVSDLMMK